MIGPEPIRKKIVIVGDGAAGKTSMLIVFTTQKFPVNYIPTVFDNHILDVHLDEEVYQLALWDTAGQEDFDRLRTLSYPNSDCVLLCFAVDEPSSLENIPKKWLPEFKKYCPTVPVLLVGCKTDLRSDPQTIETLRSNGQLIVTYQQGVHMAKKIGAWRYLECSSKINEGVTDVFEYALRAATWKPEDGGVAPGEMKPPTQNVKKDKDCSIM